MGGKLATVAALAGKQHGVVTRAQLLAAGVHRRSIDRLLAAGGLHPVHRGVYAAGHTAPSQDAREMAAVLACGAGAALSHQSAGGRWGMRPPWRGDVHVTAKAGRTREGIIVHRTTTPPHITHHQGIPITSPERTSPTWRTSSRSVPCAEPAPKRRSSA